LPLLLNEGKYEMIKNLGASPHKRLVIFCAAWTVEGLLKKKERPTSNVQHRPSEIEKKFHGIKMGNKKTNEI